jgi:hypothetical protein
MNGDDRRGWAAMSDSGFTWPRLPPPVPIEELERQQGVRPFRPGEDVGADLWDSEEEFEAFLADVRASRQADLA